MSEERAMKQHFSPSMQKVQYDSFGFEEFIQHVHKEGLAIHGITVRQHNKVLGQFYWRDGRRQDIYSCSKSVLSLALGIAIKEGKLSLDERVVDIFPELVPENPSEYLQKITLRHCATMTPGYGDYILPGWLRDWEEDKDWVHYCMNHPIDHEPGTKFFYNNASPIFVSRTIQKRTGENLLNWLKPRLFDPLDIPNPQWFTDPLGYTVGAGNLFLNTEEMSRIGQLCLDYGKWNGQELVPEWYIKEATSCQVSTAGNTQDSGKDQQAGYGYFYWMTSRPDTFQAYGMYGQKIYVFRDLDAVVTVAAHLEITEMQQRETDAVIKIIVPKLETMY